MTETTTGKRPAPAEAGVIPVREAHRFDQLKLENYLKEHLSGYEGPLSIQQFSSGQSNPTFKLTAASGRYVLRKKPPGKLLPSAHMIEREYRIFTALADTDVPVPTTHLLCEDPSIIGTPFYVMDFIEGRVFSDHTLKGMEPAQRRAIYDDMNRVLAALHGVDYVAKGLSDYGKPGNYFARQVGRWSKQYIAAKTDEIVSMENLMKYLQENIPQDDTTSIVHGDYQLYNLMYHPTEPRILAVLDWELSTLGHPMADLAYNCMKYYQAGDMAGLVFGGETGIPTEDEFVAQYCQRTGRARVEDWNFYLAFSFFRLASIVQGVYKRGLDGNASSAQAVSMRDVVVKTADTGWSIASR
ncbi:MAG: phosphotransferase [Myxococcales bacterium]|nr:phosphotransferase [Myxococcales bacterium]MDD9967894.1 phosphotransferase [Myxococcales bacterium]